MRNMLRSFMRLLMFLGVIVGTFFLAREWQKNRRTNFRLRQHADEVDAVTRSVNNGTFLNVRDVNSVSEPFAAVTPAAGEPVNMPELSGRQNVVYAIIRGKKSLEMRDLLPRIPGVTERTLRRDLLKLQSLGLIEKHGTTKSSIYVLKQ